MSSDRPYATSGRSPMLPVLIVGGILTLLLLAAAVATIHLAAQASRPRPLPAPTPALPAPPVNAWTTSTLPAWVVVPTDPDERRLYDSLEKDLRAGEVTSLSIGPNVLRVSSHRWRAQSAADRRGVAVLAYMYLAAIGHKANVGIIDDRDGAILFTSDQALREAREILDKK